MKVRLTQYLCENRHCIIASAWEDDAYQAEAIETAMKAAFDETVINPWCGLCGSTKLHFETGILPFTSVKEATEALQKVEAEQALTRKIFSVLPKKN